MTKYTMLNKFNLIVTTFRYREYNAIDEMLQLLADIGDSDAFFEVTNISGLITGNTTLNPFRVIEKFKGIIRSEDWRFRYVLRVIPIEAVTNSSLPEITMVAADLSKKKISSSSSFKLSVEKRHNSSLRSLNLIRTIAKEINSPVDLEAPSWIVLIEILGKVTGVVVLRDAQIFNSTSEKRNIGTMCVVD
ncbi:MAG TPA: THUMP domain-containing protein [Nitrososphaeraceae archaeon]|nr:THUMP domain-containing protein [Nitrososphaeraceae archaeon]